MIRFRNVWLSRTLVLFFVTSFCHTNTVVAHPFNLAVDHSPPFSIVDSNQRAHGIAVDLVNALLKPIGHSKLKFITCPWARCLVLTEEGEADFIVGLVKTPARLKKFAFIEPAFITSTNEFGFYQLSSSKTKITSMSDIEKLTVGVQRGAMHFEEFDNNKKIDKVNLLDIASLIEMLKKQRIDVFVMPRVSAEQYLVKYDANKTIKRSGFIVTEPTGGYIVFSKKSKHISYLPELNKSMKQLHSSGKIKNIMSKYNLD